jgi:hypothetical protein
MISNYLDFITESKLELLLEAKIVYTQQFLDVLDKIDSNIASQILSYKGKDMDVARNYIDINRDKTDSIFFKPQDKIDKALYTLRSNGGVYDNLSKVAEKMGIIHSWKEPSDGQTGKVIKKLTLEEVLKISPNSPGVWSYMYDNNQQLFVFQFEERGKTYEAIILDNYLVKDVSKVTPTEVNVGRFVRAFLKNLGLEYKDTEIEDFVDKYKKVLELQKNVFQRFKEVKGDEIKKWYLEDNYEKVAGPLGGSCMRHKECQGYFDIYTENTDKVSMIILMSEEDPTKICGRAILWLDDKRRRFMDRIYTIRNSDILLFKEYCYKNEYYHKSEQSYDEDCNLVYNGDEVYGEESLVRVSLKKEYYDHYPYMDTMKYYSPDLGIISNREFPWSEHITYYTLTQTNGSSGQGCDICDGGGIVDCPECEGERTTNCRVCHGTGESDCSECEGQGEVDCNECSGTGTIELLSGEVECATCSGTGKNECETCDGEKRGECYNCDGRGEESCDICNGRGEVGCPECN